MYQTTFTKQLLRKFTLISATIFLFATLISSCKKSDNLGVGIAPTDLYKGHKTIVLNNFTNETVADTFLITDEVACANNFFGSYNDAEFGILNSSFITEFRLPATNTTNYSEVSLAQGATVVSAYLQLDYNGSGYGSFANAQDIQHLQIFKLDQNLSTSATLYSNLKASDYVSSNPVLDTVFLPEPVKLITTPLGDSSVSVICMKLNPSIFSNLFPSDADPLLSDEKLLSVFKGLYFKSLMASQAAGTGNISTFNLKSVLTKLVINYKLNMSADTAIKHLNLRIITGCRRVNIYNNVHSLKLTSILNNTNSDAENIYLQGMASTNGILNFNIDNLFKDSLPISIVKANLEIPINTTLTGSLLKVPRLKMWYLDADNKKVELADGYETGAFNTDGFVYADLNLYKFNIAKTLQRFINDNIKIKGFFISCDNRNNTPSKVVLQGKNNIKLTINYTKF